MRALWTSLVVLAIALFATVGCADCPIHKALFGSDEDKAAEQAPPADQQAAAEAPTAPSSD